MKEVWAQARHLRLWLEFLAAGVVICALSLALLDPSTHELLILIAAGAVTLAVTAGGVAIFGTTSALAKAWPAIAGLAGMGIIGVLTHGLGPALGGVFTLTFVYVGLTQPPWTSLALMPLGAAGWLEVNRPIEHAVVARLPVALSLWIFLGELLSRFTAERDKDKKLLADQATHDALTGLLNRYGLDDLLARSRGGDAIAFLDIDHFKRLNDERGHQAGDRALADLGRAVTQTLRADDVAVRYGGEEVLVLLPATSADDAIAVIDRVRRAWAPLQPDVTFSAGIAVVGPRGGIEATRQADAALYLAKERGRDRTESAPTSRTRTGAAVRSSPVRSVKTRASGS